jgi:hypothetical protein
MWTRRSKPEREYTVLTEQDNLDMPKVEHDMTKKVCLMVSHNTRIQCLWNLIKASTSDAQMKMAQKAKNDKIRFKNCAILRIEVFHPKGELRNKKISVKIVYSGELAASESAKLANEYYDTEAKEVIQTEATEPEAKEVIQAEAEPDLFQNPPPQPIVEKYRDGSHNIRRFTPPPVTNEHYGQHLEDKAFGLEHEEAYDVTGTWGKDDKDVRFSRGSSTDSERRSSIGGRWPWSKPAPLATMVPLNETYTETEAENIFRMLNIGYGNYVFYIVRHGQAKHNETDSHLERDTDITGPGAEQAERAGHALATILKEFGEIPTIFLVSDLKRTHQTMSKLLESMGETFREKRFIVLPCASEISQLSADGQCDLKNANTSFLFKNAFENYSSCTADKIKSKPGLGVPTGECTRIKAHILDWSYYLAFYGGFVRSEVIFSQARRCRDTNMLANAIEYIKKYHGYVYAPSTSMDSPIGTTEQGGKRKTRRKNLRFK